MMDETTRTFFCGDLFTQGGRGELALQVENQVRLLNPPTHR